MKLEELSLSRSSSSSISNKNILPSNYIRSSALHFDSNNDVSDRQFVRFQALGKTWIRQLARFLRLQGLTITALVEVHVLDRGEKIELLLDKRENLLSQIPSSGENMDSPIGSVPKTAGTYDHSLS
ncbi:hypothetical protein FRX31_033288 [Thalictrum thalictroides]|uniref:Uncharacterized protein n=1 Tax=Thalictrum thalictroides TaxID=46969 RepID=A0A7J6UY50_THATH|nr:hypothetical protein FRX31_033288 [Thalictrum thalictroides]